MADHFVRTAREQGWSTLKNGELLRAAEDAGFDVLLTTDTNIPHQQPLEDRKLAIVVLSKNRWRLIQPRLKEIVARIISAKPGTSTIIELPN